MNLRTPYSSLNVTWGMGAPYLESGHHVFPRHTNSWLSGLKRRTHAVLVTHPHPVPWVRPPRRLRFYPSHLLPTYNPQTSSPFRPFVRSPQVCDVRLDKTKTGPPEDEKVRSLTLLIQANNLPRRLSTPLVTALSGPRPSLERRTGLYNSHSCLGHHHRHPYRWQ